MRNLFVEAMKNESKKAYTENGAEVLNTTSNPLLDVFSKIGAMRKCSDEDIIVAVNKAFAYDEELVMKLLFYARDVLYGLGERRFFRVAIRYVAYKYPNMVRNNFDNIVYFGRFDDLYALVDTIIEEDMWQYIREIISEDIENLKDANASVSLAGKWLYSPNTTNKEHARLGRRTAKKLGLSLTEYRHLLSALRERIEVVEQKMCDKKWGTIVYQNVPSLAMLRYSDAFIEHDSCRFHKYLDAVKEGSVEIKARTLTPKDIVRKLGIYNTCDWVSVLYDNDDELAVIDEQWKALPNFLGEGMSAIGVVDTSGSMYSARVLDSAIGLGIYLAERNKGPFHNKLITFSSKPSFVDLDDATTLVDKVRKIPTIIDNTNLRGVFDMILSTAVDNNVPQEDLPNSIIIFSDMQIDGGVPTSQLGNSFTKAMAVKYAEKGYKLPTVIYWNLNARRDTYLGDVSDNIQLFSGNTPAVFSQVMNAVGKSAYDAMLSTLNSPRYDCIKGNFI